MVDSNCKKDAFGNLSPPSNTQLHGTPGIRRWSSLPFFVVSAHARFALMAMQNPRRAEISRHSSLPLYGEAVNSNCCTVGRTMNKFHHLQITTSSKGPKVDTNALYTQPTVSEQKMCAVATTIWQFFIRIEPWLQSSNSAVSSIFHCVPNGSSVLPLAFPVSTLAFPKRLCLR